MAVHLLLMNAVAPALVLLWRHRRPAPALAGQVFPAMAAQMALLWLWHAPPLLTLALHVHVLHLAMQATLLLARL